MGIYGWIDENLAGGKLPGGHQQPSPGMMMQPPGMMPPMPPAMGPAGGFQPGMGGPPDIGPANLGSLGTARIGKSFGGGLGKLLGGAFRRPRPGGGMGAGSMSFMAGPELDEPGNDAGAGGGGWFDGMHPLEKAFLITSALGAAGDIGGGIYDRVKQSQDEDEERRRRAEGGRQLTRALSRPRTY